MLDVFTTFSLYLFIYLLIYPIIHLSTFSSVQHYCMLAVCEQTCTIYDDIYAISPHSGNGTSFIPMMSKRILCSSLNMQVLVHPEPVREPRIFSDLLNIYSFRGQWVLGGLLGYKWEIRESTGDCEISFHPHEWKSTKAVDVMSLHPSSYKTIDVCCSCEMQTP